MRLKRVKEQITVVHMTDFIKEIESNLPITAYPTQQLCDALRPQVKDFSLDTELLITSVFDTGIAGGIVCSLQSSAFEQSEHAYKVSLTHLKIDPKHPLAKKLKAYQKQRLKNLCPW